MLESISDDLIDKIFLNSVSLSVSGIEHFITQLVKVSAAEVSGDTSYGVSGLRSPGNVANEGGGASARVFALQRIVEVASVNMNIRSRIVWTRIWGLMSRHFAVVGCHSNETVAMYAIDSLRQLSFKFLEKPELSDFSFQRLFLQPFLVIIESDGSRADVKELILRCIEVMVQAVSHNIRSGWRTIFSVLTVSARDEDVAKIGLEILHQLVDEHLDQLTARSEDFTSMVKAAVAFIYEEGGKTVLPAHLSLRAVCYLACFSDRLSAFENGQDDDSCELWRLIIGGLSRGCIFAGGRGRLVGRACVCALRAIMLRHRGVLSRLKIEEVRVGLGARTNQGEEQRRIDNSFFQSLTPFGRRSCFCHPSSRGLNWRLRRGGGSSRRSHLAPWRRRLGS